MKPSKMDKRTDFPKKNKRRWLRVVTVFLLVVMLVATSVMGVYGVFIERDKLLTVNQTIVLNNSKEKQTLRAVHFTDTHLGAFFSLERLEILVAAINAEEPDMVFFTGDLVDKPGRYKDWDEAAKILGKIASTVGKYAVAGNHDSIRWSSSRVKETLQDGGFVFLQNEQVTVLLEGDLELNIIGLDDAQKGKPDYKMLPRDVGENTRSIVLAHAPDMALEMKDYDIDLVLSGHTHGGQVKLPLMGAVYFPPFGRQFTRGLYQTDFGTQVYVDSGAGETGLPLRIGVPPQFSVLQLEM